MEAHAEFPKAKNGKVHIQRVKDMLVHVLYAGRLSFPKGNIHNHPAKHEALISFEEWRMIQNRLNPTHHRDIRNAR